MPHFLPVAESGKQPHQRFYTSKGQKLLSLRAQAVVGAACDAGIVVNEHGQDADDIVADAVDLVQSPLPIEMNWARAQSDSDLGERVFPRVRLVRRKGSPPLSGTLILTAYAPAKFCDDRYSHYNIRLQVSRGGEIPRCADSNRHFAPKDATTALSAFLGSDTLAAAADATYYERRFWSTAAPDGRSLARGQAIWVTSASEREAGRVFSADDLAARDPLAASIVVQYKQAGYLDSYLLSVKPPLAGSLLQATYLAMRAKISQTQRYYKGKGSQILLCRRLLIYQVNRAQRSSGIRAVGGRTTTARDSGGAALLQVFCLITC